MGRVLFLLGALFFSLIPLIFHLEGSYYRKTEPFFISPVEASDRTLFLRNDDFGKGHFGASRNGGRTHKGIDLSAPLGSAIRASKSGRVVFSGQQKGYGNVVELAHSDGFATLHAHLNELKVKPGQWVKIKSLIGTCGKTGNADHPQILSHLHFEIQRKGQAINPITSLDPSILVR